jgi:YD repeat-containing protein
MRRSRHRTGWWLAGWMVVVGLSTTVRADEQVVRDPKGRIVQRITEEGVAIWYRYDDSGRLVEERRSDGKTVQPDARTDSTPNAR